MNITILSLSDTKWRIRSEIGVDENGKRRFAYETVTGTRKDAEKRKRALMVEHDTGAFAEPSRLTLHAFFTQWNDSRYAIAAITKSTHDNYAMIYKKHVAPTLGGMKIQTIAPAHISNLYAQSGLSAATLRHLHRMLSSCFRAATAQRLLTRSPLAGVDTPKVRKTEADVLSPEQIDQLLALTEGTWKHDVARWALHTGLRRGELLGLRWTDVGTDHVWVRGQRTPDGSYTAPKTDAGVRRICVDPALIAGLELGESEYVFGQSPEKVTHAFKWLFQKMGAPHLTFHSFRHTHATMLLRKGAPLKAVSRRLGHSNIGTTMSTYAHASQEDDADLAAMVSL